MPTKVSFEDIKILGDGLACRKAKGTSSVECTIVPTVDTAWT
jgi:hypothetical protein